MTPDIIATVAGILTSSAMTPQIIKVIRDKNVENLSNVTLLILITGLSMWLLYGIFTNDWAIILFNGIAMVIDLILLIHILKYKNKVNHPYQKNLE